MNLMNTDELCSYQAKQGQIKFQALNLSQTSSQE